MSAEDDVASYYDANTASFSATGQGGTSIRRAIWAPGVATRDEAFRVIDRRVLGLLQRTPQGSRVADLGSGVGSSLLWLRQQVSFEGFGVTISAEQARIAADAFGRTTGLTSLHGSFAALPPEVTNIDVAFAIESFVLATSADDFFAPITERMSPGATLLVCDDFLGPNHGSHAAVVEDFRWGWVASSVIEPERAIATAAKYGLSLEGNEDLTSFVEIGRPRDHLLDVVVAVGKLFKPKSWLFRSWVGGTALQKGLKRRALEHRLLTFIKK